MNNFGFIKVAASSPKLKVANPFYNAEEIKNIILEADKNFAKVIVFPELSITGYTCADLFSQKKLINDSYIALKNILDETKHTDILCAVGMPILINHILLNCAVLFKSGKILAVVPKMYIPNYREFYEKRWFTSGFEVSHIEEIDLFDEKVPFGNVIIEDKNLGLRIGVEICEDVWAPIPPSSFLCVNGANIILNLSASNEVVAKSDYRRELIKGQSARCICGYIYSSASVYESTTDLVFSGDLLICENGSLLKSSERFKRESQIIYSYIDVDRLNSERQVNKTFIDSLNVSNVKYQTVNTIFNKLSIDGFDRYISKTPFIPSNKQEIDIRCNEIFNIQVAGLAKRFEHTGLKKAVIGISGGLDSTLALLVTYKTFKELNIPPENIIAITMPGFGTTDRTYTNAVNLIKSLKCTLMEINIKDACLQHFKDIGHDKDIHDLTYENTQARERTQILMDIANKIGGIVVGTGDLSELALGWCTYNGDHMSMYAVNASIPKTLIKFLVDWYAEKTDDKEAKNILKDILDTPISPELLPPDKEGNIKQKTEDTVGPYELHDFFIYYAIRYNMPPEKVLFLAEHAFSDKYDKEYIKKWQNVFYRRFFTQQFKRSCMPDGPKVGSVCFSPRGDLRMPSDADSFIWLS
ncbi:NAD(+) synthase [Caloramator sp. ALD01]|uniref:NAD(+) synthase n=1 Tax=Caloramator sp. ALD01 TaxID=1031288 RepID=UPI00040823E1|nr:NAD(+) synthase [Caloramator sp. ALD01]